MLNVCGFGLWQDVLHEHPNRPNHREVVAYNHEYCQRKTRYQPYSPHAGGISVNTEGPPQYTVLNYHTNQIRTHLSVGQVLQALRDLDITDSRWAWNGPYISYLS